MAIFKPVGLGASKGVLIGVRQGRVSATLEAEPIAESQVRTGSIEVKCADIRRRLYSVQRKKLH